MMQNPQGRARRRGAGCRTVQGAVSVCTPCATRQSRAHRPRRVRGRSDSRPALVRRRPLSCLHLAYLGTVCTFVRRDGGYSRAVVRRFVRAMFMLCGTPALVHVPPQSGPPCCLCPALAFGAPGHDVLRRRRRNQAQPAARPSTQDGAAPGHAAQAPLHQPSVCRRQKRCVIPFPSSVSGRA